MPEFSRLRWLLILVITLHNFEEWVTFPIFGETGAIVAAKLGMSRPAVPWPALQFALFLVTILPALLIAFASLRKDRLEDWIVCATGSIFLANVFIPHLPAAVLVGGYSPGLVTAVFLNLPFIVLMLITARREQRLTLPQLIGAITAGMIALPISLIAILRIASALIS